MALNGLDAQALKDAFDFACTEPGWFCMKYESRDDIVLLGKGASAVKDMRELISHEPDDSPIYGFIRYRRRNILIKLVPENTSRVLKARSQVHFQSVVERFSPCDVTVSLKSYRELTDAALTTACSTHTATASISSSSSSLRQRRLTDIQEASEEGFDSQATEPKTESKVVGNQQGLQVIVTTHDPGVSSDGKKGPIQVEISAPEPIKVEADPVEDIGLPDIAEEGRARSSSLTRDPGEDAQRRKSTSAASLRPSASDIYAEFSVKYQPKVKLGPRPSADWNKRPHTASSSSVPKEILSAQGSSVHNSSGGSGSGYQTTGSSLRPTSSVPKNVYLPPRKTRSGSNGSSKLQFHELAGSSSSPANNGMVHPGGHGPPPLQFASANTAGQPPNSFPPAPLSPTPSFASVRSTTSTFSLSSPIVAASPASSPASAGITPERARLMKALELRKRAMSQQTQKQQSPSPPSSSSGAIPATAAAAAAQEQYQHQLPAPTTRATTQPPPPQTLPATQQYQHQQQHQKTKTEEEESSSSNYSPSSSSAPVVSAAPAPAPAPAAPGQENLPPTSSIDGLTSDDDESSASQFLPADEMSATVGTPPKSSSSSTSASEQASLENSIPDTPTQDTYTTPEIPATENNSLPSPTQAPSTSTEHDSQKSFSDDFDKESESSYGVSDINGDSIESNTITDDGEDRITTRLQPPPPTLLLPTPKPTPAEALETKQKSQPNIPKALDLNSESKKGSSEASSSPPRSPLLHLNMLAPRSPGSYLDSQKLPKAHNRLPSNEVPVIETARSVSAPFLNNNSQDKKPVLVSSRKVNVSSGSVSQRIKQLEMLAKNKPAAQAALSPPRSRPSSPTPQQFPPVRTNSLKTSTSSPNLSPLIASGSTTPQQLNSPFLNKPDTNGKSFGLPLGNYAPGTKSRSGSIGDISIQPGRKLSMTNLTLDPVSEPPSAISKKDSPPTSATTDSSSPTEKKSRLPPLLRRMSSSKSKKSPGPATPATPATPLSVASIATPPPPPPPPAAPVEVTKKTLLTGWVNVQLPDTMLWKRRYLKIESDSWLYLTMSEEEGSPLTGKYNIKNEIRSAAIPDIDEQELPNSVNLRLIEGGVLACACQNIGEQSEVLKVVRSCIA